MNWSDYGGCLACGAPAGTPCLDLRMGPKASITRPHRGRGVAARDGFDEPWQRHLLAQGGDDDA